MNTKVQFLKRKSIERMCLLLALLSSYTGSIYAETTNPDDIKISIRVSDKTFTEIFDEIESLSKFTFAYDEDVSRSKKRFSFQKENISITGLLDFLRKKSRFDFKIFNNTITVIKKETPQQIIRGTVIDNQGMPLPGATIIETGTSNGTTTNFDGNFSLRVPSLPVEIEVSFMGFQTRNLTVSAAQNIEVVLQENTNALNEVVVTALGIKREEKQLGFSQATVEAESLSQTAPTNWSSGLKGKVAGMNVVSSGSGPINSQQITLRGNSSFDLNGNYALIVVDGVPVNTEMTTSGSGSAYMGEDSPIDYGNGISNLNFDDIESVSVLKGPGAAALYGSRAANGVLMITTKSGQKSQGLGITINSIASFDVIQRWPDYQYKYGQGNNYTNENGELYYSYGSSEDGGNTGATSSAWGPEFNGQYYYQYDPEVEGQSLERQLWRPYKDNRKAF